MALFCQLYFERNSLISNQAWASRGGEMWIRGRVGSLRRWSNCPLLTRPFQCNPHTWFIQATTALLVPTNNITMLITLDLTNANRTRRVLFTPCKNSTFNVSKTCLACCINTILHSKIYKSTHLFKLYIKRLTSKAQQNEKLRWWPSLVWNM